MATFHLTVYNERGQPLNGVIISNGQFNTTPVSWPSSDTTGPGGTWQGTTNSSGRIDTNVQYTCPQTWQGTLQASGFDDYPYSYTSGSVTGDFYDSVQMVASSTSLGATSNPSNSGANPNAGNLQDQGLAIGDASALLGAQTTSNIFGTIWNDISGAGIYVTVALVALAIIVVALAVVFF